jgi:NAD(P)-dependent dehydrogenase (short-subunit alcohol dehydrogenase family)
MPDKRKVAIVTGAGQGLGEAVALAFAANGIHVAAVGRTEAKLRNTVAKASGKAIAVPADLTQPDQVRTAFRAVTEQLGGIDILVNCAAEYSPFRLDEATDAQITNMVTVSLTASLFCMREAINWMRQRGGGDIVNITTQSVVLPQPFMTVYAAAKAGVETVSEGLRYELKGENIRVMICQIGIIADTISKPGFTELQQRMNASWTRTGIGPMYAFPGSDAKTIAASVVHAVNAPRDTYIQAIQLRGMDPVDTGGVET